MSWSTANQRDLVRAVDRVRQLLERYGASESQGIAAGPAVNERRREVDQATTGDPANDADSGHGAESCALAMLVRAFNLSAFERDIVLLCAGVELDARFAPLLADAHGDASRRTPTFGLALALLPDAHWSALSPDAPLRAWRLLELAGSGVTTAALRIDERVLNFLAGVGHLDERLHGIAEVRRASASMLATHGDLAATVARSLAVCRADSAQFASTQSGFPHSASPRAAVVQLIGADPETRVAVAECVGAVLDSPTLLLRATDIPAVATDRAALARLMSREAILGFLLVVIEVAADVEEYRVVQFVRCVTVPVVVTAAEAMRALGAQGQSFAIAPATQRERLGLWQDALGARATALNGALTRVTSQFALDRAMIQSIATTVLVTEPASTDDDASMLWDRCRAATRPRMEGLAHRIEAIAQWEDLVLPESQRRVMRTIASHVRMRHRVYEEWGFADKSARGLGIAALFAGASGTGKTMAAEVLARELQLDLYRIDLASVVSKYIGETEKNLKRLFDTAEGGGAILLFDEADALFGKRSDVKDSHDRYANIETSYLLQRMESYRGLAILTTNMRSALDPAFTRRIRFVVNFPFPGVEHRAAIWRGAFPARAPIAGMDWDRLAQLNVAGGQIRNIALSAAFLAADRNEAVDMRHLVEAAHAEYAKTERAPSDAELRGWV